MHKYDCVVVGAGFTGLAAAQRLARNGHSVLVLEQDKEVGGLAGGFSVGSVELEKFYHHWFTNDTYVTDLAAEIGCAHQVLTRDSRTGMYFSGNFFKLSTPLDLILFKPLSLYSRIRTGIATLALRRIRDWKKLESLTAREWLLRYFGKEAFEVLWEPLLVGKFGSHADRISAVWFWKKLALRGSSRGKGGAEQLSYYRGGFARLARDIAGAVTASGSQVSTGIGATSVTRDGEDYVVAAGDGEHFTARNVLITTPLKTASSLLRGAADPAYCERLNRIEYLGNVCLVLVLDHSLSDIYWLNVNDPSFPFVGIIEHTNFEPTETYEGRHIVYLSRYLDTSDPVYSLETSQLVEFALPHIQRMFPDFDAKWIKQAFSWRVDHAQPIIECNYSQVVPEMETPLDGVYIASMAQVYPEDRGTNYAIREGWKAADVIMERLASSEGS